MNRLLILLGIGVGIGILIAPDKGSSTRRKLGDWMDSLQNEIDRKTGQITEKIDEAVDALPEQ